MPKVFMKSQTISDFWSFLKIANCTSGMKLYVLGFLTNLTGKRELVLPISKPDSFGFSEWLWRSWERASMAWKR